MAAKQEPRDFLAEAALLCRGARMGMLATVADGVPHAALVTPALAADGVPLLLLSELSIHTRQLLTNPACALLLTGTAASENPQTAPRLCLTGRAVITNAPEARAQYLARHPYAAFYADFTDFAFWRLKLDTVHYVGGFAAAAVIDPAALQRKIVAAAEG